MTQDLAKAREAFGFGRLGPVVAAFLLDLDAVLEPVARRGGRTLFVAPGGRRIQQALDALRQARGASARAGEALLQLSPLEAAAGAWTSAREAALAALDQELGPATAAGYLRRLDPDADPKGGEDEAFESFSAFLQVDGPLQRKCRARLEQEAERVSRDVSGLIADSPVAALVDVGGQEPLASLLALSHPRLEVWRVVFGGPGEAPPSAGARVIGLGFSGDYTPEAPLTALARHPGLLEALFSSGPGEPDLYEGVLRYVREVAPTLSYSTLLRERDRAAAELAQAVLHPDGETALLLGGLSSPEPGGASQKPALLDPAGSELTAEQRIAASRWPAGQIALECRPSIARERQRALLPKRAAPPAESLAVGRSSPKVAIIMRTKDRLLFLQRAFEGIARQTYEDFVLVVFNDGGDVAGVEAELELSRLDRRKVILLDGGANRGMEAASNAAIAQVASEYIVIHDDDDSWHFNFLDKTVGFLDANPAAVGVVTRAFHLEDEISGDQVIVKRRTLFNPGLTAVQLSELLAGNLYPPISFVFRRAGYEAVGGFDESLPVLGDWHFNVRLATQGEIAVIPEALANYHYRADPTGSYANSIVGGSDLHARYIPVVRQKLLAFDHHPGLGAAAQVSPMVAEVRRLLLNSRLAAPDPGLAAAADDRWCLLAYVRAQPERAREMTLRDALQLVQQGGVAPPPDFDEAAYLEQNPDVRDLVRTAKFASGFAHFMLHGRQQGRGRPVRAPGGADPR